MPIELDVHGFTWLEALKAFKEAYDIAVQQTGVDSRTVKIIHGYGSKSDGGSVIRVRLRRFLERYGSRLEFQPGETLDGNSGYTLVIAGQALPDEDEYLEDRILEYCEQPRTMDKIAGKFRRYGQPKVQQAIRSLTTHPPLLQKASKGRYVVYQCI